MIELANSKQSSRRCTCVHSSASRKIVSMRIVVLTYLNEKVGFKIPTTRYRKNSILCGALHIGTAKWISGVGWSFRTSRVARGIKGSGTGLTFDPLRIISDLITKQKKF